MSYVCLWRERKCSTARNNVTLIRSISSADDGEYDAKGDDDGDADDDDVRGCSSSSSESIVASSTITNHRNARVNTTTPRPR